MFYLLLGLCYPVWHSRKAQLLPFDGFPVLIHITFLELSEKEDNISFTQFTGHVRIKLMNICTKTKNAFVMQLLGTVNYRPTINQAFILCTYFICGKWVYPSLSRANSVMIYFKTFYTYFTWLLVQTHIFQNASCKNFYFLKFLCMKSIFQFRSYINMEFIVLESCLYSF